MASATNDSGDAIRAYYKDLFDRYGEDVRSLGWSEVGQKTRFQFVLDRIPQQARTLLDVGCGFGDFSAFLAEQRPDISYTGWDLSADFIAACHRNGRGNCEQRDILSDPPAPQAFDVVILIGALNTRAGDNEALVRRMLTGLYEASALGCLFMATSIYVDPQYKDAGGGMYYYDPAELFRYARTISRKVDLHHSYLPHDFCLALWK